MVLVNNIFAILNYLMGKRTQLLVPDRGNTSSEWKKTVIDVLRKA
jgi:hypothetical protein